MVATFFVPICAISSLYGTVLALWVEIVLLFSYICTKKN